MLCHWPSWWWRCTVPSCSGRCLRSAAHAHRRSPSPWSWGGWPEHPTPRRPNPEHKHSVWFRKSQKYKNKQLKNYRNYILKVLMFQNEVSSLWVGCKLSYRTQEVWVCKDISDVSILQWGYGRQIVSNNKHSSKLIISLKTCTTHFTELNSQILCRSLTVFEPELCKNRNSHSRITADQCYRLYCTHIHQYLFSSTYELFLFLCFHGFLRKWSCNCEKCLSQNKEQLGIKTQALITGVKCSVRFWSLFICVLISISWSGNLNL